MHPHEARRAEALPSKRATRGVHLYFAPHLVTKGCSYYRLVTTTRILPYGYYHTDTTARILPYTFGYYLYTVTSARLQAHSYYVGVYKYF